MKFSELPEQAQFFDPRSGEDWRKISSTQAVCLGGGDAIEGGSDTFAADDEVQPRFEFVLRLQANAATQEEAYEKALQAFVTDPGSPESVQIYTGD